MGQHSRAQGINELLAPLSVLASLCQHAYLAQHASGHAPSLRSSASLSHGLAVQVTKKDAPEEVVADWGSKLAKLSALKEDSIVVLLDA